MCFSEKLVAELAEKILVTLNNDQEEKDGENVLTASGEAGLVHREIELKNHGYG